jgi:hypothetical protein
VKRTIAVGYENFKRNIYTKTKFCSEVLAQIQL